MQRILTAVFVACLVALTVPALAEAQLAPPFSASVVTLANLRSGPGTSFDIVDVAVPGQTVQVVDCNTSCSWYSLSSGHWIAAFLVEPIAGALPISPTPTAPPTPSAPARSYTMPDMSTLMVAQVVRITDGDTIRVRLAGVEYPLRYIGVNTPEVGQPYAAEATALNSTLVSDQAVYLEKDVSETDRYNRLLRYVWLEDGTFVNYELVRQGYAQVATFPPDVKYEALYLEAQRQAVAEGVGLWVESAMPTPAPAATSAPVLAGPTANRNANLRGGPGTSYAIVESVSAGQALQIVGRTSATDWYQLASGAWIAAFLVDNAPGGLPVTVSPIAPVAPPTAVPVDTTSRSSDVVVPAQPPAGNCDPSYPDVCIPPYPPDLDCGEVSYRRFRVVPPDPHRFDGDHDGIGCER